MRRSCIAGVILAALTACNASPTREPETAGTAFLTAEPWHEADRLFFDNPATPEWKGADVANSVGLGDGRVLWVFGDTLLAQPGANRCERFDRFDIQVHNSLALQLGVDPATASIRHFWGEHEGQPNAFFRPDEGIEGWYWMGGVTVVDGQALVFLMHARAAPPAVTELAHESSCAGLEFEMLGWDARIATITSASPDEWRWRTVALPDDVFWHDILVGSSTVSVEGDYLYAWSSGPAVFGSNPVYLARWSLAAAAAEDLRDPEWYTGTGWTAQRTLGSRPPVAVVADGNNEVSVARDLWPEDPPHWWWLQSREIVRSKLCYRNGESRFGFGECRTLLEPPELQRYPSSNLLVYAAKFHPALATEDNVAIATYVVNSCQLKDIQEKCDLYYPRFIKLRRHDSPASKGGASDGNESAKRSRRD